MYDIEKCEKIVIPQGALYLGPSNKKQSVGYLELEPRQSLTLHNRPAVEKLTQVTRKCDMVVYRNGGKIVTLEEGDTLSMPPGTYHIHANPYEESSLTYWDFNGDITEIIEEIRKFAK